MAEERAHARLGASSAARWMACPGSVQLSAQAPPKKSSAYAEEGTRAHELAEKALRSGKSPAAWQGQYPNDMIVHVAGYANYVVSLVDLVNDGRLHVEQKVSLNPIGPPEPMFGTVDCWVYHEQDQHLHVIDLKYGAGVVVEAVGNPQTRYYALGAMLACDGPVSTVTTHIYQPRAADRTDKVRVETLDVVELLDWGGQLLDAARIAVGPEAPLRSGAWCRWCPAAVICPVLQGAMVELARDEWAGVDV